MLKFIISKVSVLLIVLLFVSSCVKPTKVTLLMSENNLKNLDSIKIQTPNNFLNKGWNQAYSNLPIKLREKRDNRQTMYEAWDEIVEKYKVESNVYIDTISKSETIISRVTTKWLYLKEKRNEKKINTKEFKQLLKSEGVLSSDYQIRSEKEVEWTGGSNSTFIELWYNGTINEVRIGGKGEIRIHTYLTSQIPYWESQGHQFSTTTPETIEKYAHKRGN